MNNFKKYKILFFLPISFILTIVLFSCFVKFTGTPLNWSNLFESHSEISSEIPDPVFTTSPPNIIFYSPYFVVTFSFVFLSLLVIDWIIVKPKNRK